jgi:hypothetical protein
MLILNPASVQIAGVEYTNVESCAIDRTPHKEVVEWSDNGAFAVFADVPEQKVEIKLTQRLEAAAADQVLERGDRDPNQFEFFPRSAAEADGDVRGASRAKSGQRRERPAGPPRDRADRHQRWLFGPGGAE